MNKSAPAAKKAPAKTAMKPRAGAKATVKAKAGKPTAAAKPVSKPRALSEKQILARQQARETRELAKAERRSALLREKEDARMARQVAREEKKKAREAAKLAERLARKQAKAEAKATRGRPKRPGLPTIKKEMELEHTDLLKPWTDRPFTGRDLDVLSKRFGLTASEFASALGLQNRFQFTVLLRSSRVVPFDVEMLARLYEMSPTPAPWRPYSADEVFKTLYGPLIDKFGTTDKDRAFAETHYSVRFTATLDRSSSTAYRWMDSTEGVSRMVIAVLLRKVMSMPNPRETLESLSALVHRVRGGDLEKRAPAPVEGMQYNRRGRVPGASRTAARDPALQLAIRPLTL